MEKMSMFDFGIEDTHYNYTPIFDVTKPIRLFESFAGIGCQRMAMKRLGIPFESVGISEIDKYAIMSYEAIHGKTTNYGDICKMESIPPCDIFTWSFPCTDLSKAGKQKGLDGTRSGLVYEVLRIVRDTAERPKVLIMENVPDLVQVKFAADFYEIQKELESYGYQNYTRILNGKDFGVAQNRERVFMISILGGGRYEFPIPFPLEKRLRDYLEESVDEKYYLSEKALKFFQENSKANEEKGNGFRFKPKSGDETAFSITTLAGNRMDDNYITEPIISIKGEVTPNSQAGKVYGKEGISPSLCAGTHGYAMGYISEPICLNPKVDGKQPSLQDRIYDTNGTSTEIATSYMPSIAIPEAAKQGYALAEEGDGVYINRPHQKRGVVQKGKIQALKTSGQDVGVVVYGFYSQDSEAFHRKPLENVSRTLKANTHDASVKMSSRIRKLTPRECWRLMGIDDECFDRAAEVCSNTQLYKQAGNGIVVDTFAELLKGLFPQKGSL